MGVVGLLVPNTAWWPVMWPVLFRSVLRAFNSRSRSEFTDENVRDSAGCRQANIVNRVVSEPKRHQPICTALSVPWAAPLGSEPM